MSDVLSHLLVVFMGFFAIMNPIANTAAFISMTADKTSAERKQIAMKSLMVTFAVIAVFSLLGKVIFELFGLTMPGLRLTGGILIFLVGYHMLNGSGSSMHSSDESDGLDIAVSPLAVPLLAGPGTIATAMNFSAAQGWGRPSGTIAMFALLCLITYVCFLSSDKITKFFGKSGLTIVTRLMGLILAVIGADMFVEGVYGAIQAYPG